MGIVVIQIEHPIDSEKLAKLVQENIKLESAIMKKTGTIPKIYKEGIIYV